MAEGKRLTAQDLELAPGTNGKAVTLKEARETAEREIIERVMRKHSGKITAAATELEISRPTLYEWLEKLGIVKESA